MGTIGASTLLYGLNWFYNTIITQLYCPTTFNCISHLIGIKSQ